MILQNNSVEITPRQSGLFSVNHINRQNISLTEHGEVPLPVDLINTDGSLDIYSDVQTRFSIEYKGRKKSFFLRSGGWVGHIPLNDRYILDIEPRVPISNLERMIARSPDATIHNLGYSHAYKTSIDRPQSFLDLITDYFLTYVDKVREEGLLKRYEERTITSSNPRGYVRQLQTAVHQARSGKTEAVFQSFVRTADCAENRIIRLALDRLFTRYSQLQGQPSHSARISRLREALIHFDGIGLARPRELSSASISLMVDRLPWHRRAYADPLRLAQYVAFDWGFTLRGSAGVAVLPAIVIDMAAIFENYARAVLFIGLRPHGYEVLDGNKGYPHGAERPLYDPLSAGGNSPSVNPDIVIMYGTRVAMVIDVKYKPAKKIPERSDTNQLMTYAARYDCQKVAILYPNQIGSIVTEIGKIGLSHVFSMGMDLQTDHLEDAENLFVDAIRLQL